MLYVRLSLEICATFSSITTMNNLCSPPVPHAFLYRKQNLKQTTVSIKHITSEVIDLQNDSHVCQWGAVVLERMSNELQKHNRRAHP